MRINDPQLGECEVEITVAESTVDSFIDNGYAVDQQRELSDAELERFNHEYTDKVQEFAWLNGSKNHN